MMKFGEKNMGEIDRAARALLAMAFLGAYAGGYVAQEWAYAALALGFVMIATAAYESCPLYSVLGMSTCAAKKGKK